MRFWKSIYLHPNFYRYFAGLIVLWVAAEFWNFLAAPVYLISAAYALVLALELIILYRQKNGLQAERICGERFSNGDDNKIQIRIISNYYNRISLKLIDEVPEQFQWRDNSFDLVLEAAETKSIVYYLKPVKRGPYRFGALRLYASLLSHSIQRGYKIPAEQEVKCYPSFLELRKYELIAFSDRLQRSGEKKVRRISISREFEKIDRYVEGDDYRRINWKATARSAQLMVNHYRDERSQNIVAAIDKGRTMRMPFGGLSLLDHAINASLVLADISLKKSDRPGLVTVQHRVEGQVYPENRNNQLQRIMEALYAEKTSYKETDFRALYRWSTYRLKERSLMMLYTNFETVEAMRRQLPYLSLINRKHRLLVIFFLNEEVEDVSLDDAPDLRSIYRKGLAEDMILEKRRIATALQKVGIQTLLTRPADLRVEVINKYLEMKNRGLI